MARSRTRIRERSSLLQKTHTEPVRGPDESRIARIVAKRLTDFSNKAGEIGFRGECCRPQELVQLVLRKRAWTVIHIRSRGFPVAPDGEWEYTKDARPTKHVTIRARRGLTYRVVVLSCGANEVTSSLPMNVQS
jgi:hypothetical protein